MKGSEDVTTISAKSLKTLWKTIWIHKNDHELLRIYRNVYKISMTAVLHMMIGVSMKCLEEKHLQEIASLKKQRGHLASIVLAYRDKYGDIRPKKDVPAEKEE